MAPFGTRASDGLRYLQDSADLRVAIQYNLDDSEFAKRGGRIVYLMDANVARLFLSPASEERYVAPFAADSGDHLVGTAVVTAEFLFSRQLPGQQGAPALIAPGHGDDLGAIVDALRNATETITPEKPTDYTLSDNQRTELRELIAGVRDGTQDRRIAYRMLRYRLPGLTTHLGMFDLANQLYRLYNEDLLRPLAIHPYATAEVLDPDLAEVNSWTERLHIERLRTDKQTGRGEVAGSHARFIRRQKDNRDATAIVQAQTLNRHAEKEPNRRRYVLVTGDKVIQRTYATWFWSAENPDQDYQRYLLRHPIQYIPILNVADMPNRVSATLIDAIREALDTLLTNIRRIDNRYPYTLSYYSARLFEKRDVQAADNEPVSLFFGINPYQADWPALQKVINAWRRGFRDSMLQNAALLGRRAQAEFGPLAELLDRDTDLNLAILTEQRKVLLKVEAAHLAMGTQLNLQSLPRIGERATQGPGRAPFAIRVEFKDIVGGSKSVELRDVLDLLVRDRTELARISRRLQKPRDHMAMFFGACVAFRCALWTAAKQHVRRALGFLPPGAEMEELRHEMRHLLAVAIRFSITNASEFAEANDILMEAAHFFAAIDDPLGQARALSERVTLNLWVVASGALLPQSQIPFLQPILEYDYGLVDNLLGHAERDRRCRPGGEWHAVFQEVTMQLAATLVAGEVLRRYFTPRLPRISPRRLERAIAFSEKQLRGGAYPKFLNLEVRILRWDSIANANERAVEGRAIARDCRRLADDPTAGELTDLDRAGLKRLETIVAPG
jgi:hypothetical protein